MMGLVWESRDGLCVGALHTGLLAVAAQHVLFDELVARAAVQAELQAVAADTPDDDGSADVAGLYFHLPAHPGAAALCYSQAAALAASASSVLKGKGQIVCDHSDLKEEKNSFNLKTQSHHFTAFSLIKPTSTLMRTCSSTYYGREVAADHFSTIAVINQ
uniref:Uncharacterized protein n=1 Tax=Takifugu rubripes TaxID=31033 RepID=A0A674NDB5_TAKRU